MEGQNATQISRTTGKKVNLSEVSIKEIIRPLTNTADFKKSLKALRPEGFSTNGCSIF